MSNQLFSAVKYGSIPMLSIGLLQLKADESVEDAGASSVNLMKPKDLPVYSEPKQVDYHLIPEGPSGLRDMVALVREQVWKFSDTFQGAVSFTQKTYKTTEETTQNVVKFIKTEEGFYPRAGVISVAGLAGLVLARRGGILRKVLYSGGLMTATASLCYPYQAVRISKAEMEWIKTKATDLYKGSAVERVAASEAKTEVETPKADPSVSGGERGESSSDASQEDHGQSKAEDKDMYTTRS